MPSLGPDMESGMLVEWKIKPGDVVKRGDIVALVETDKGVIDVEIFASGTVTSLLVPAGTRVPVGSVLAQLDGAGESAVPPTPQAVAPTPTVAPAPMQPSESLKPEEHARQRVSPAARARAKQLGVDLAQVHGSGPHGAVTLEDVIAAARPAVAPVEPAHDMRQIIAKAMTRSKREIPHYYLSVTVDFSTAQSWIERYNASAPIENRILPAAVLIKAVAIAAAAMPEFNGFYRNDAFVPSKEVHVGMAIAMRGGRLAAPALLDA
ncbi:MAG TPA: 2-oxo acid dehydrogenase subunit E2, partial [Steroidobacteraceae bacterium]|nr:2-oxo acid dehydrogenase subunit E2 [Steroidobacteraceae bacterium]